MDRVVDFTFGSGETAFHVILELYAAGNIILTDHAYVIMNLLRTHQYDESVNVAVREVYPIAYAAGGGGSVLDDGSADKLFDKLKTFLSTCSSGSESKVDDALVPTDGKTSKGSSSMVSTSKKAPTLKSVLGWSSSPITDISPLIVEHALYASDIKANVKVNNTWEGVGDEQLLSFASAIHEVTT